MEHLIDKIIAAHKLTVEVDKEIETCGVSQYADPAWHIFQYKDFVKVAEVLGETPIVEPREGDAVYAAKYMFRHRGVNVFCLRRYGEEAHDASTAN